MLEADAGPAEGEKVFSLREQSIPGHRVGVQCAAQGSEGSLPPPERGVCSHWASVQALMRRQASSLVLSCLVSSRLVSMRGCVW